MKSQKAKTITLQHDEYIIAVVPEYCAGPGWSNTPVWVYIASPGGKFRIDCLQPEEQSRELHLLFRPGEAMCRALHSLIPTRKMGTPKT